MGKKLVNINRHKDDREDEITNKDVQTHIINMFNMLQYLKETWGMVR